MKKEFSSLLHAARLARDAMKHGRPADLRDGPKWDKAYELLDRAITAANLEDSIEGVEPADPNIVEIEGSTFFRAGIVNEVDPGHVGAVISSLPSEKLKRNKQEPPSPLKARLLEALHEHLSDDFIHDLSEELADNALRLAGPSVSSEKMTEELRLILVPHLKDILSTLLGDDAMEKTAVQLAEKALKALHHNALDDDPDEAIICIMGR